MPLLEKKNSEKGQILLVVVLASVISLTVGLAAISRSITNTRVSTEESNSQKALAAAEAGIEEQLNNVSVGSLGKTLSNGSSFSSVVTQANEDPRFFELNNKNKIKQDDGADVWLSTYPNFDDPTYSGEITVFWQATDNPATCSTTDPAIEIAVISGSKTTPNMARYAVDSCGSRRLQNKFSSPTDSDPTPAMRTGYNHKFSFNVSTGRIARIIPLYADAKVAVESQNDLLPQGYIVSSTGSVGTTGDMTVRKVRVFKGFPTIPIEFFPYNLFIP